MSISQKHADNLLRMTSRLVAAYVSTSKITTDEIPGFILRVHRFLKDMPEQELCDLLERTEHPIQEIPAGKGRMMRQRAYTHGDLYDLLSVINEQSFMNLEHMQTAIQS